MFLTMFVTFIDGWKKRREKKAPSAHKQVSLIKEKLMLS